MMELYHGSFMKVDKPLVNAGRRNLDFGRGFYLTNLRPQAEKWALAVGGRHNDTDEGVVNVYHFDEQLFAKYKVLSFACYDLDWLDFVVVNRHGEDAAMSILKNYNQYAQTIFINHRPPDAQHRTGTRARKQRT